MRDSAQVKSTLQSRPLVGIVAEPGLFSLPSGVEAVRIPTPYGPTSAPIEMTSLGGTPIALLASRGPHTLPPALLPARANIWALARLGVRAVIVITAAGGLRHEYAPGAFVVSDQLIDRTWGRPNTFYDQGRLVQLAAADPFDPALRRLAISALQAEDVRFQPTGTVVVIQGPRFNTRAESRAHASSGADLVNMLLTPFTPLAQELGMGVCNVSFITDRDADDEPNPNEQLSAALIERRMAQAAPIMRRVIGSMLANHSEDYLPVSAVPPDAVAEVLTRPVRPDRPSETSESNGLMSGSAHS